MRSAFSNGIRVSLGLLVWLLVSSCLLAQKPRIDALADQTAVSLSRAKQKTVLVFDFVGPDGMDALGQKLAADFRAALARSGHDFQVEDRSRLLEILQKNKLLTASIRDRDTAFWYLRQTGVDASVLGTLSNASGCLTISLQSFSVKESELFSEFETSIPLTDDLKALIGESEKDEFASMPRGGKDGYSFPSCISCQNAQLSREGAKRNAQGTVVLEVTVDEDGNAKAIRVKQAMPYGITEQVIETVQEWRFKPATGPDGKAAAVRQTVEMKFWSDFTQFWRSSPD